MAATATADRQVQAEAVTAVAADHQAAQNALTLATVAAVLAVWSHMTPSDWFGSWWRQGLGSRIYVLLSIAQESVAAEANQFVYDTLSLVGPPPDIPVLVPSAFAGIGSDGRDLESLLAGAPVMALQQTLRGQPPAVASKAGADYLRTVVATQIPDAGRAADQVAIATADPPQQKRGKKLVYGWVRMLTPPSCERCIVLAGRFYKWNDGFLRHPMCDCRHIPAIEALDDDLTTDPYLYFKSLSPEEQNDVFGVANSKAIRDGADINQVLNAATRFNPRTGKTALMVDATDGRRYTSEGTTKRGYFGSGATRRAKPGVLRPTPWQIYQDARGNRDEAKRLLTQFGYILR